MLAIFCATALVTFASPEGNSNAAPGSVRMVPSRETGWPQWRGPGRDAICTETNLLQSWPEGGPRLLWQITNIGSGYSAPIINNGRIYLAGDVGEHLVISALSAAGAPLWRNTNGASWKNPYPGARASCTYSSGKIVHMNAHAQVACFDASTGRKLWTVDLREKFGNLPMTWATSECLLVDDGVVYATVGGTRALMAALDLNTGRELWTTPPIVIGEDQPPAQIRAEQPAGECDPPSYSSPILIEHHGRKEIVGCSQRHIFCVSAKDGKLLWTRPLRTQFLVVAMTPALVGDAIFATGPDTKDGALHRLKGDGAPEEIWKTKLDTCHGGVVVLGDRIYGSWYRSKKGWACLDAKTGESIYDSAELAKGSVLYADKRLYVLSEEGEMALMEPAEKEFVNRGKFRLVAGRKSDVWTHPVIHDGKLYLRYHDTLWCYDAQPQAAGR